MTRSIISRPTAFLTESEEKIIVSAMRAGDRGARECLIECHLRLAAKIAKQYSRIARYEDLFQEACAGLCEAADRFDPERSLRFAGYAIRCIKNALNDYARRNFSVVAFPSSTKAKQEFSRGLRTASLRFDFALDAPRRDGRPHVIALPDHSLPGEVGLVDRLEHEAHVAAIRDALACLTDRERSIVERRHMVEDDADVATLATLETLAGEFGVSRERIRQIEQEALTKLSARVKQTAFVTRCNRRAA